MKLFFVSRHCSLKNVHDINLDLQYCRNGVVDVVVVVLAVQSYYKKIVSTYFITVVSFRLISNYRLLNQATVRKALRDTLPGTDV